MVVIFEFLSLDFEMTGDIRRWIKLIENVEMTHRVYHGSPNSNIDTFKIPTRNRTGTPNTLSFTTSVTTAKIYGDFVYAADVKGTFGDYLNDEDVETNFIYRWPKREAFLRHQYPNHQKWCEQFNKPLETLEEWLFRIAKKDRAEIAAGHYAQWENIGLWTKAGWDGAWCLEHDSRNLIVGNIDCVQLIGRV